MLHVTVSLNASGPLFFVIVFVAKRQYIACSQNVSGSVLCVTKFVKKQNKEKAVCNKVCEEKKCSM